MNKVVRVRCAVLVLAALCASAGMAWAQVPPVAPVPGEPGLPVPRPPVRPFIVVPRLPEEQPVRLASMDLRARIVGIHAETVVTMTFFNPNRRAFEGDLVFPLPDGAAVTGYALDVQGAMVDGVVVRKEAARMAFEAEVRRGVDPGLVEQVSGNVYRTRVYPLPAGGTRTVRITYAAGLASSAGGDPALHIPMPAAERVDRLSIRVEVLRGLVKPQAGGFGTLKFSTFEDLWVATAEMKDVQPGEDIWVSLPALPRQTVSVELGKDGRLYFSASDLVPAPSGAAGNDAPCGSGASSPPPSGAGRYPAGKRAPGSAPVSLGIAWDASGSRAGAVTDTEIGFLRALFERWPEADVILLPFRDRPETPRTFAVRNGDASRLEAALKDLRYDGATSLPAAAAAMRNSAPGAVWMLFTDGIDTLPGDEPDFSGLRVNAVVSRTVAERELLRQVSAAGGGQLVDLQLADAGRAADMAVSPPVRLAAVRGDGISDVEGIGAVASGRVVAAGRLASGATKFRFEYTDGSVSPEFRISGKDAAQGTVLSGAWAAARVTRLSVRPDANADELLALGRSFGLVSPVTSLIVFETVEQYARYGVKPPESRPDLVRAWEELRARTAKEQARRKDDKLQRVIASWYEREVWWDTTFKYPLSFKYERQPQPMSGSSRESAPSAAPSPGEAQLMFSLAPRAADAAAPAQAASGADGRGGGGAQDPASGGSTIAVKPWDPAAPYIAAIKSAGKGVDARYAAYLVQRDKHATEPSFYLDCADFFLREGHREAGLRILGNLAELNIGDPALLRVLAWRLAQAGEMDLAVEVLREVARIRPDEPQSPRDLALALADRGKANLSSADLAEAMALLKTVIMEDWARSDEFGDIEVIALGEFNALAAWCASERLVDPTAVPKLDSRLLRNLDVGVRIVLSWDADNTDIDLHVVEPSGEEAMYDHPRTTIGGRMSRDCVRGYGPEEYLLRKPMAGTYVIFANYYGSSEQTVIGPVTVTATVFTDYGQPGERRQVLTFRLDKPKQAMVEIGSIEVKGGK